MMNKSGQGGIADTLTFKNTEGEKQKDNGSDHKTLRERSQNTVGARNHSHSVLKNET